MRLTTLIKRLDIARANAQKHIDDATRSARESGSRFAVLAGEGYAAGYRDALDDVDLASRDVPPPNRWGFWPKEGS